MTRHDFWLRDHELGLLLQPVDEVLTDKWNRFRVDPIRYLDAHHERCHREPQAKWVNGLAMGNGDMGVMSYGAPEALSFSIGKTDLWDYTPMERPNFPEVPFDELRDVLARQDHHRFNEICEQTKRQVQVDTATAKPAGMLRLEICPASLTSCFQQRLSYAHAQVVQSWRVAGDRCRSMRGPDNTITLASFVHAARNVFATRITAGRDLPWLSPVRLTLWREQDHAMEPPQCHVEGDRFWVRQDLPGGEHFILMAAVDSEGFQIDRVGDRIYVSGVPSKAQLSIYATVVTSRESSDPVAEAQRNLEAAQASGFKTLQTTHRQWWHTFWRRGYVCTPWAQIERAWYEALYLQASCCRPGRISPGLQSNLIKENYPAWNSDFHNNINMQVLYAGQYTANRLELAEPFYRLMSDVLPRCRQDTAAYFNMRGARYPLSMGMDGVETASNVLLSTWIGAGGWIAQHFWWHYRYSGDKRFLKAYAYPMLKECALFYEDYLQEDADGKLYLFPTLFMEVATGSVAGAGKNSSWDLPIVIRTFETALEAAEELEVDADLRTRWRSLLTKLSPLPTDERGVWLEFADKGGLWHHWDWARFMAVFPMELVSRDQGPEALRRQAQQSIEELYTFRADPDRSKNFRDFCVGFSGLTMAAALFRMGEADRGFEVAQCVCDGVNASGFITAPEAGHFQVDAPPGFSVLLNEMLLQSAGGLIRVFPAVPATDDSVRFHSLRAQGGFLISAERRKNLTQYVVIQSLLGNRLRLLNPFVGEADQGVEVKIYELNDQVPLTGEEEQRRQSALLNQIYLPGQVIDLPTRRGGIYLISKEIPWYTSIPIETLAGAEPLQSAHLALEIPPTRSVPLKHAAVTLKPKLADVTIRPDLLPSTEGRAR